MTFDPNKHITQIQGKDYLEVKWRLVWFRQEHPDGSIDTALISETERGVTFKATVSFPSDTGIVIGTGWAFEPWDKKRIGSPHENGETSAVGRALAHMGYGTQFAPEMDMADDRLVDSPIPPQQPQRAQTRQNAQPDARPHEPAVPATAPQSGSPGENANPATQKQIAAIHAMAPKAGLSPEDAREWMGQMFNKHHSKDLSIAEASALIERLQSAIDAKATQPQLVEA